MEPACSVCGESFEREAGFFLGSIYLNYGLTAIILAVAYPLLLFTGTVPTRWLFPGCLAFALLFPLWFFRYARALWLAFDQFVDPRRP